MLKILIVDDEHYFRQGFKILLPFEDYGFEICGEARNGEEALQKVIELKPDIVVVDINMPVMDGLEFSQAVKDKGLNTRIIILTGYGEFAYAKHAIELGVHNYLLKPVSVDELKKTLLSLKEIINTALNFKLDMDYLKSQVKETLPIIKDRFLYELLKGNLTISQDKILDKLRQFKINIQAKYYCILVCELDIPEDRVCDEEEKQLWRFAVSNIAVEILESNNIKVFQQDINEIICIWLGIEENNYVDDQSNIIILSDHIIESVQRYLNFTVTIGIGETYPDIYDVSVSYKEACFALRNKITLGTNTVISFSAVNEMKLMGNPYSMERRAELLMNMRLDNAEEINTLIDCIFRELSANNTSIDQFLVTCIEMISTCFEFLSETGQNYSDVFQKQSNLIEELQAKKSIVEMNKWIKDLFSLTTSYVFSRRKSKSQRIVNAVIEYIESNYYNEELDIDELARNLYINYGHLCYLFKKESGKTINDFITEFRINKAKELMDNGNHFVQDIANKVGYTDQGYFGKCFKKYTGLTPSKYIDIKR